MRSPPRNLAWIVSCRSIVVNEGLLFGNNCSRSGLESYLDRFAPVLVWFGENRLWWCGKRFDPSEVLCVGVGMSTNTPIPTSEQHPVRIEPRLLPRISVREFGLPSLVMPGKIWRSEQHGTITCMVVKDADNVSIETRPLEVIGVGEMSWMPDSWRAALWEYVRQWPSSGCQYGPFLAISETERNQFLRDLGRKLLESDDIGCRLIAHDIGLFASVEFEVVSDCR